MFSLWNSGEGAVEAGWDAVGGFNAVIGVCLGYSRVGVGVVEETNLVLGSCVLEERTLKSSLEAQPGHQGSAEQVCSVIREYLCAWSTLQIPLLP